MSFADAQLNEPANTSQFSTPHSHNLSAYSQDEKCAVVPVDALYIDLDIPSANARTTTANKFLIDSRVESRESEGNDAQLTIIVESQEVLYLCEKYCGRMTVEMERYKPICNLANHIIRRSNIPSVRKDPKVTEGVCKSERKSDIIGIWDGRAIVANKLWKSYDERDPPVHGRAGQTGEADGEGADRKGADGSEKDRLVPRDWKCVRHVAELEKSNKTYIGDSDSLSASTLDLKWPIGPVNRKHGICPPKVYLARAVDDLLKMNSFRWRTAFFDFDEISKQANRICHAIIMERPVPLRYVKHADHFKQAIREVVLANHLVFSNEWHILHRHISVDNLMIRYYDAKSACGALIDFDLTVTSHEDTEDHSGTRTGSRPFMAWEVLESDSPPNRLERFDWESFFYVICWIGCRYSEGKEVNKSALSHWYESDDLKLSSMKQAWLFGPNIIPMFTTFYEDIALDWAIPLQMMFRRANDARYEYMAKTARAKRGDPLNERFDEVTVGGQVTWDKIWGILQD